MTLSSPLSPNYYVLPKLVPAGRATQINIRPGSVQVAFDPAAQYRIFVYPIEELDSHVWQWKGPSLPAQLSQGMLTFSAVFNREQRYILGIEKILGDSSEVLGDVSIYALQDDLFQRFPYKGDLHMHSSQSDGVEPPAYVAAMCRKIGLDFMAVTDHRRYEPSLEAQRAFQDAPVDLVIFPGEEVHPPENPIHIVNFGGRFSINELFKTDAYQQEVQALQVELGAPPAGANAEWYASAVWCFRKIRQAGGLGIFCHPYWFANHMLRIPESLTTALFETQPYDALELIGGYFRHEAWSNNWQVARYYQEVASGKRIPIVGVSDSHGCHRDLFGWYYSLVFSPSLALEDLVASIKAGYSVAVEAIAGEVVRIYGDFRLVKYAHFILPELMPPHDLLCQEEGQLMLAYLEGDPRSLDSLRRAQGRTARLLHSAFQGA